MPINDVKLGITVIDQMDTYFVFFLSNLLRSKHHQNIEYSEKYAFNLQTIIL